MNTYSVPGRGEYGLPCLVIDIAGHPNSYRLKAICLNCKWEGQLRIAKGERASRGIDRRDGYECPMCACWTVEPGTLVSADSPDDDSRDHMKRDAEMWGLRMDSLPDLVARREPVGQHRRSRRDNHT